MSGASSLSSNGTIIQAGAGAGKTTRLIKEVLDFYQRNKTKSHFGLVLTTFSNKATQELKERLFLKASELKDDGFFKFINDPNSLLVSTIHGILTKILVSQSKFLDLPVDLQVIDGNQDALIQKRIFKKLMINNSLVVDLILLYSAEDLFEIVTSGFKNSEKIKEYSLISAKQIKQIFDSKVKEWIETLGDSRAILTGEKVSDSWVRFMSTIPMEWNRNQLPDLMEISEWMDEYGSKPLVSRKKEDPLKDIQLDVSTCLKEMDEWKKRGWLSGDWLQTYDRVQSKLKQLTDDFTAILLEYKKDKGILNLEEIEKISKDLSIKSAELFIQFGSSWDFWLIDEFQDTNGRQLELLNLMIQHKPVIFVGDPQQSIYLFRGADTNVFSSVFEHYAIQKKSEFQLNNYRSELGILNFINYFFESQYSQFKKMIPNKKKTSDIPDVLCLKADTFNGMARSIVTHIKDCQASGVSLNKIAILSRRNRDLKLIQKELENFRIPSHLNSHGNFFQRQSVLDILFFVQYIIDPSDEVNLVQLLSSDHFALDKNEIYSWKSKTVVNASGVNSVIEYLKNLRKSTHQVGITNVVVQYAIQSGFFSNAKLQDSSDQIQANIWKLVLWIQQQIEADQLVDSLKEILDPRSNIGIDERESIGVFKLNEVELMTIHASKGLEFEVVILLGCEKKLRRSDSDVISFDDQDKQYAYYVRSRDFEKRIKIPLSYEIKDERHELELEENERLLYVALTRAQKQIVFATSGKFENKSWMEKVDNFLQRYDQDKFGFVLKSLVETNTNQSDATSDTKPKDESLKKFFSASKISDNIKWMSFSTKQEMESFTSKKSSERRSIGTFMATQRGVKIHKERERLKQAPIYYGQVLENYNWKSIFENGFAEFGFSFSFDSQLYVGSIDFVFLSDELSLIIDYKSGVSIQNPNYRKQVQFYAQCLSLYKKWPIGHRIMLCLDFVDLEKIELFEYRIVANAEFFKK